LQKTLILLGQMSGFGRRHLFIRQQTAVINSMRPRCGLDRVSLSKSCFAANSMLRWHDHVTGEARWPAMKEEPRLRATATAAARDR
jgi:hypothetical protein